MSVFISKGRWPRSLKKHARELERRGKIKTVYDISHKGERCVVNTDLLCRAFDCKKCEVYHSSHKMIVKKPVKRKGRGDGEHERERA